MYKLVMLVTPFVNGAAELETEVTRLVNESIAIEEKNGYALESVQVDQNHPTGILDIACHYFSK